MNDATAHTPVMMSHLCPVGMILVGVPHQMAEPVSDNDLLTKSMQCILSVQWTLRLTTFVQESLITTWMAY